MPETGPVDPWTSAANYERYVGRWSRLVADAFLRWLGVPPHGAWLDVGCGTGALTQTILALAEPASVTGVDRSEAYIEGARARVTDPRATFVVSDAQHLPDEIGDLDAAVSGLVLNFVPGPQDMVGGMMRAVRPGGVVALYVWDYAGEMQFMRHFWDAAVALDPGAAELDEGPRFPLCAPDRLAALFTDLGSVDVEARAIDVATRFADLDDFWSPFLGGQGPAPAYVASLSEERRDALRDRIAAGLPVEADGSIDLIARAWAVRGRT